MPMSGKGAVIWSVQGIPAEPQWFQPMIRASALAEADTLGNPRKIGQRAAPQLTTPTQSPRVVVLWAQKVGSRWKKGGPWTDSVWHMGTADEV